MQITDEIITYVAALARIDLQESEREQAKNDLGNIISYINMLNELDTTNVEPMSHTFDINNVFREDRVLPSSEREQLLENAPSKQEGCYKVPKTVE